MATESSKKATKAKRAAKAKAAKPMAKADKAAKARPYDHVSIAELDVVLLQTLDLGALDLEDVVFSVFSSESERRRAGTDWLAFHRSGVPHHTGKSDWIGLSKSVSMPVIDTIQAVLEAAGMQVEREMGRALHLKLNPFARLSDDGLEILVPAALVGDPAARRVIDRGGVEVVARGYTAASSKAATLNELFFGSAE